MQRFRLVLLLIAVFGIGSLLMGDASRFADGRGERIEFPIIRDWNSLRIALTRTACFGTCPAYTIEIQGNETITYQGRSNVAILGKREGKITAQMVREHFARFRAAEFFSLRDYYVAEITDYPTYVISIAFDGNRKVVGDYAGYRVGMPVVVRELEYSVDWYADSKRWVGSNFPIVLPPTLHSEKMG